MQACQAKSMNLSDYIVFEYKTHTHIRTNFILNYENFEVLAKDDIYMIP